MKNISEQNHLSKHEMVNLGSYYTKPHLVDMVYDLLYTKIDPTKEWTILDSSCGYGSFFKNAIAEKNKKLGSDIDSIALNQAKQDIKNLNTIHHNSLVQLSRSDYTITNDEKLIIVGNPPYNDTTSIIRNEIKSTTFHKIHDQYKTRDLGISFLRSYANLDPDFICILHPLSYLIKKANFDLLGNFTKKYQLIDGIVVSSAEFNKTALGKTYFPIVIALYEKSAKGMMYSDIEKFIFKTIEGPKFSISNMVSIKNYLSKYPNQKWVRPNESVAKFWTMRDINALKRSKTFVNDITHNTILIQKNKLPYYCYVDVFKRHINNVPYYLGNCDVFIDNSKFNQIKDCFVYVSAKNHPELQQFVLDKIQENPEEKVNNYFKNLLGEHYVEAK